jgi:hypothetical protein
MSPELSEQKIPASLGNKDQWWELLSRFIECLNINAFVVDALGHTWLPPEEEKGGGRFFVAANIPFELKLTTPDLPKKFLKRSRFLECDNRYGLKTFALPVNHSTSPAGLQGYVIVGPVILNARPDDAQLSVWAKEAGIDASVLREVHQEIRVVPQAMMDPLLELFSEIIKSFILLKGAALPKALNGNGHRGTVDRMAQEIYKTVMRDELLVTLLDLTMCLTGTECGSIMLKEEGQETLQVKIAKGINWEKASGNKVKIGEGLSGWTLQTNAPLYLNSKAPSSQLQLCMKRQEIKQSLLVPLSFSQGVKGVLSLHTKEEKASLETSLASLQHLSNFLSYAI